MPHTRRAVLAGAAALSATTAAAAQEPEAALQPIEGNKGASVLGPRNLAREDEGPDTLRPPATDHGTLPNMRFSFADAHMEIKPGGWSREVTQRELPISTSMAGVNMRLTAGGVRELHWHKEAEWAFLIAGRARITAVDNEGRNFAADVGEGDLCTSRPESRTRFKAWRRTAASFCWPSRTGISRRAARSSCPSCSSARPRKRWPRISA